MNIHRLTIGTRLMFSFGLLILMMSVGLALAVWSLRQVSERTHTLTESPLAKERLVSDWYRAIHTSVRRTTAVVKSSDPALAAYFDAENKASSKAVGEQQKLFETLLDTPQEKARYEELMQSRKAYVQVRDSITAAKLTSKPEEVERLFNDSFQPAAAKYLGTLQSLLELQRNHINETANKVHAQAADIGIVLLATGGMAIVIGIGLSIVITRSIVRPLADAVHIAQRVAQGDLRSERTVTEKDETGLLLNALCDMIEQLRRLVVEVRSGTESIADASVEIEQGNMDLSSRTENQASAMQQTAVSVDHMAETVRKNSESAREADHLVARTTHLATEGRQLVGEVVSTMGRIHASSGRIVDIIGVIDGIAFQTNILALNAAVEAARAGEQGRGFAVVAAEVRQLAQRSASAAKEIKGLISESVQNVDDGNRLVSAAGESIQQVEASVRQVATIVAEFSSASREQTSGIEQINQAISQVDTMTQQNAALVEEAAAATTSLKNMASRVSGSVAVFQMDARPAQSLPR